MWKLSKFKEVGLVKSTYSIYNVSLMHCRNELMLKIVLPVYVLTCFFFFIRIWWNKNSSKQKWDSIFSLPLLRLIFHVRLPLASRRVECWVMSVWCQVSWCLHCCKAILTHMYSMYTRNLHLQTGRHMHWCTHTHTHIHCVTCILHMHAQMYACSHRLDSVMTLVSLSPDQSSQLPSDLLEKHSSATTGEGVACVRRRTEVLRHEGKNVTS